MEQKQNLTTSSNTFTNSEGIDIFCKCWAPETSNSDKPRAVVFICHGAGEHCQVYGHVASQLVEQNIVVCAHDHVGHGKSGGERVYVETFDTYVNDFVQHVDLVQKRYPDVPLFVVAHSMGGTIAVRLALKHPQMFKGIVLIGPAVKLVVWYESVTKFVTRMASKVAPRLQTQKIDAKLISRDPAIVKQYEDDELVYHGGLKTKFIQSFFEAIRDNESRLSDITWPYLLIHGDCDKLCDVEESKRLHQLAASKDKTLKIVKDAYHQVHNEPNGVGTETITDVVDWINKRI